MDRFSLFSFCSSPRRTSVRVISSPASTRRDRRRKISNIQERIEWMRVRRRRFGLLWVEEKKDREWEGDLGKKRRKKKGAEGGKWSNPGVSNDKRYYAFCQWYRRCSSSVVDSLGLVRFETARVARHTHIIRWEELWWKREGNELFLSVLLLHDSIHGLFLSFFFPSLLASRFSPREQEITAFLALGSSRGSLAKKWYTYILG